MLEDKWNWNSNDRWHNIFIVFIQYEKNYAIFFFKFYYNLFIKKHVT